MTITLQPSELVLRRNLQQAQRWFETIGKALSEDAEDPIGLVVPSVIIPEYNVVLYPRDRRFEPEFVKIDLIEPFDFDRRFFNEVAAL
jgi:hypothetical protein